MDKEQVKSCIRSAVDNLTNGKMFDPELLTYYLDKAKKLNIDVKDIIARNLFTLSQRKEETE